ncbi:hypothetical protein CRE_16210 [Caenorhabditis remanei]|uniref:Uncharacterized protein n=1 Tax=Caenorhabditis remanei TaxID=31234 RepID=E3MSL3_CAERE|nr:hypothetical protein CRE_16210 [Caenorhabditis remanei]
MKILIFLALVFLVAGLLDCDWVPNIGCGGTHHVCKLRATLGWGALNRKEAAITVQNLQCDWVPTIGCGGRIHVCEWSSTVGWGVFDREEAEGLVIYHKKILKLFGERIVGNPKFGEDCPLIQGKNLCCKITILMTVRIKVLFMYYTVYYTATVVTKSLAGEKESQ